MRNNKRKALWKILRTIILAAFAVLFAFSAYKVINIRIGEEQSKQLVDDLKKKGVAEKSAVDEKAEAQIPLNAEYDKEAKKTEEKCPISVNFDVLKEDCQDIVAWIYCPDTPINYPIAQGPDNQFYLTRLINGEYNNAGTLFIDFRNLEDFSDRNTIIYGHNMNNGTMFGILPMYRKQEYYEQNPVMYLLTADKSYKMELFSSFITPADSDVYRLSADENSFEIFISELTENSDFKSSVSIDSGDRIVTLSTCSYEYDAARRVVIGVLKEISQT